MRDPEPIEADAHTPAPDYQRVFEFAFREAVSHGKTVREAEQTGADAASEFLHPNRARCQGAKDL